MAKEIKGSIKYILCKKEITDSKISIYRDHLVGEHNADANNILVRKYLLSFIRPVKDKLITCNICKHISHNTRESTKHDLLKHYELTLNENDNFQIQGISTKIKDNRFFKRYTISSNFTEYSESFDWYDPSIADIFVKYAKNNFDRIRLLNGSRENKTLKIQCIFSIINVRQHDGDYNEFSSPRVWSSDTLTNTAFNDTMVDLLVKNMHLRIINNGETGSSWKFYRYDSIEINIIDRDSEIGEIFGGRMLVQYSDSEEEEDVEKSNLQKKEGMYDFDCMFTFLQVRGILTWCFFCRLTINFVFTSGNNEIEEQELNPNSQMVDFVYEDSIEE